tara:strand:+ start:6611 stop:8248 length:1638 start_codon:yes stop_codon:yes gene_type:complete
MSLKENFKESFNNILFVSRLTKTGNKKLIIVFSVILSNLSALMDILLILAFTAIITDKANDSSFSEYFINIFVTYKWLLPVVVLARYACIYFQSIVEKNLVLNVQKNLKVHVLYEVFDKRNYSVADAYFYINDITGHISFFYTALIGLFNSFIQILGFSLYLIFSDTRTILTFGVGAAILYYPSKLIISQSRKYMDKAYNVQKKSNYEIQKIVDNMFLIKLLRKDKDEIRNFKNVVEELNSMLLKNHKYGAVNSFLPSFITMFVFSILIGISNIARTITLDFIGVTLRLFQSLGLFSTNVNRLVNSQVHIKYFYEMEMNKNFINKKNHQQIDEKNNISVDISNLSFEYFNNEKKIFENLNLQIPKNKHVILTGPNGSGKSTLLGLISGVLYSQNGSVKLNSKKIGYIGANPLIFTESLRYNLLYGNENKVSDEDLLSSLKKFDFFQEEERYNLDLIVDNKSLSSGQMQKLAFIRALSSGIDTLLLDESTANLDEKTKEKIFNILSERDLTIINSTHDPDSFENVDYHFDIGFEDENRIVNQIESN